jgi:hypothetical protein
MKRGHMFLPALYVCACAGLNVYQVRERRSFRSFSSGVPRSSWNRKARFSRYDPEVRRMKKMQRDARRKQRVLAA